MKTRRVGLFVLLISSVACADAWAQATAQMSGTVRDQSGAVLPGVEITATQTGTGVSRTTISNETGSYALPNLALGPYRLEATLPGFRTYVQTGIVLQVNSNPTLNITLDVGQVTEQVEIQANAGLVETRSLSVGQVMETSGIVELPLNGRNVQELLLLGGAAVQSGPAGGMTFNRDRLLISSAGGLGISTETLLDGMRHIDTYDGIPMPLPFPDALAEFKTEIGGISAQQGRGTEVSAVTKSGTNQFHGDVFEFVRNDLFNARNYFSRTGSTLKRNQFGGTVGGPILHNKLFFFGGYQGTTLRQDPADSRTFVPTAAMLAGDFTVHTSSACSSRPITLRAPFVNNRIDPRLFDPIALKLVSLLPKPETECGELTYGRRSLDNSGQVVSKVDYQVSSEHSVFGRFLDTFYSQPNQFKSTNIFSAGSSTKAKSYAFSAGSTYVISPTTVNAFRLSFTRNVTNTLHQELFGLSELGSKVYDGYEPKNLNISITSGFNLSAGADRKAGTQLYQVADDVSINRGTHQFGFGGRVAHSRALISDGSGRAPNFQFNGAQYGIGLADFLLGKPNGVTQATGHEIFTRMNYVSLYAQDTWQMKPRLSISAGVRWSPVLPQIDTQRPVPYVMNWDINRYIQGIRSSVFVNAPPGILFPGDPGFQQKNNGANADKPRANIWNPFWNIFAPRLGFAWDVEGNGRTSIRASYGISYEEYPANTRLGTQSSMPPYGALARVLVPDGGLADPWRTFPGGNPHPVVRGKGMPFPAGGDYMPEKADLTPTYTESWNLSVQRELVTGTLLSASYIGTQLIHTQATMPMNLALFVPGVGDASGTCILNGKPTYYRVTPGSPCSTVGNTQDRRQFSFLNPAFAQEIGRFGMRDNGGTQNYHGMLISFTQRTLKNTNLTANYTLSHCVGDYTGRSNSGYGSSVDHTFQDPNNRRRDRGNCEMDQRHNFNLTAVGASPTFANRKVDLLASRWRLSGIYRRSTGGNLLAMNRASGLKTVTLGAPTTAQASASSAIDRCLCDISNQRPDQILGNIYLNTSGRPGTQWLNPVAFAPPALGTLGNMGRATLVLPTYWQFDVALARVFRLRESQTMEFRAEAYNVLNSFRSGEISTDLSSAQFGTIRTALDPRILQFALKYAF